MAKHFVANALNRIIDRAIQVHGALGYSLDTPLARMAEQARWARFADGADEVHQWAHRAAQHRRLQEGQVAARGDGEFAAVTCGVLRGHRLSACRHPHTHDNSADP